MHRFEKQPEDTYHMKIILYILGFLTLIGFLVLAGCFKAIF
jgi:hypothetical protein